MKVLVVFNHIAPYKVAIFNELAKLCDLTVIFERKKEKSRPDSYYNFNNLNFNHIILESGEFGDAGSISCEVKRYIKKHHQEFDRIVMNGYSHLAEMKALNYMIKNHIPYNLLINGGIAKEKECWIKRKLKKKYIGHANRYLSPSKKANEYLEFYGADSSRINVYPYANIQDDDFAKLPVDKKALRKKYDLPIDKRIFINPSMFIERKNNIALIKEFKNREDILLLVGQGKEEDSYHKFIKENNMNNVIIMPFKDRKTVFELYRLSDAFITLSKEDIYGHTTLEALASAIPVISSDKVVSSLSLIKNGVNGYIVNNQDEASIQKAIDSINKIKPEACLESVKNYTYKNAAKAIYQILKGEKDE